MPRPRQRDLAAVIKDLNSNNPEYKTVNLINIREDIQVEQIYDENGHSQGYNNVSRINNSHLEKLANALQSNTIVENICIAGGDSLRPKWTAKGASTFGKAIKDHPKLTSLAIQLPEGQATGFLYSLYGSAKITKLTINVDLETNPFFLNELASILQIKKDMEAIHIIVPYDSKKEIASISSSLKDLLASIRGQTSLRELYICNPNIVAPGEIVKTLSSLTRLESLTLTVEGNNNFSVAAILPALQNHKELRELNFSGNKLGENDVSALADLLPALGLRKLEIGSTQINKESLQLLLNTIIKHGLKILHLGLSKNNSIKNSIDSIIEFIGANKHLRNLDLDFCNLGDEELVKLAVILKDPTKCSLEHFSFAGDQRLESKTHAAIKEVLINNEITLILPKNNIYFLEDAISFHQQRAIELKKFANTAITLCQGFRAHLTPDSKTKAPFTRLPANMIKHILRFLVAENSPDKVVATIRCINLILFNFDRRRLLINSRQYHPKEVKKDQKYAGDKGIGKWWWKGIIVEIAKPDQPITKVTKEIFVHQQPITFSMFQNKDNVTNEAMKPPERQCVIQ